MMGTFIFRKLLQKKPIMDEAVKKLMRYNSIEKEEFERTCNRYRADIRECERKMERFVEICAEGGISLDELKTFKAKELEKKERLEKQLNDYLALPPNQKRLPVMVAVLLLTTIKMRAIIHTNINF